MERAQADINNMERLPEGCISDILSLTTPADVCRSSLVSTLFKSAADSDALWEKFLPPDYQVVISRALHPFTSAATTSKKELYYQLCDDPILIDGGSKSFHLQKSSGKKCIMLGAKELGIAWGDNRNHWRWEGYPGSRFPKVAELQWVCWLEIRGKLDTRLLSPNTVYAAYIVLKFKEGDNGLEDKPIKVKIEVIGGNDSVCSEERLIYFDASGEDPMLEGQYIARERGNGWMEVEMGHFYNKGGRDNEGGEVHMSVLESERLLGKYCLIVQDVVNLSGLTLGASSLKLVKQSR
ncbi:hypothetical protein MKW98_002928 [Papaver atlanticum]|uniref:F-box domain-containing protein n=1 Tax=Papaver atlanticum TaxID=357466 RepID=A0AAD4XMN9_9MAGN|nr:hypothetical protein MKW98_002928 [Papaver atlanticum]